MNIYIVRLLAKNADELFPVHLFLCILDGFVVFVSLALTLQISKLRRWMSCYVHMLLHYPDLLVGVQQ